jgi:hypothetical protein
MSIFISARSCSYRYVSQQSTPNSPSTTNSASTTNSPSTTDSPTIAALHFVLQILAAITAEQAQKLLGLAQFPQWPEIVAHQGSASAPPTTAPEHEHEQEQEAD